MVRWLKLFGDQYFGFWILGLVLHGASERFRNDVFHCADAAAVRELLLKLR